ncbi:MAG TPA: YciI family protein [Gammaproteobacteria bacterium]|nr:YciI family protein [Gammaproteobacteria bacterium]
MLMIYNDKSLLDALPQAELDSRMRHCLAHADDLRDEGKLLDAQILAAPTAAKSVRIRNGRTTTTDGPFTETKEMIAGFNVVEADSIDDAVRMAAEFPWAKTGCVEVRPIVDWADVREAVGAPQRASTARE